MARGEGRADSDIDFIYQFDDTANPMIDEWALQDDLTSIFGREIDLVERQCLFKPGILPAHGVILRLISCPARIWAV